MSSEFENELQDIEHMYDILRTDAIDVIKDLRDGAYAFRLGAIAVFLLSAALAGIMVGMVVWAPYLFTGTTVYVWLIFVVAWVCLAIFIGEFGFYRTYRRLKRKYSRMFQVLEAHSRAE